MSDASTPTKTKTLPCEVCTKPVTFPITDESLIPATMRHTECEDAPSPPIGRIHADPRAFVDQAAALLGAAPSVRFHVRHVAERLAITETQASNALRNAMTKDQRIIRIRRGWFVFDPDADVDARQTRHRSPRPSASSPAPDENGELFEVLTIDGQGRWILRATDGSLWVAVRLVPERSI